MAMPRKQVTIYDGTSGVNAALDSGVLDLRGIDELYIFVRSDIALGASTLTRQGTLDAAATKECLTIGAALTAGQTVFQGAMGPGCTFTSNGLTAIPGPIPPFCRFSLSAGGAGVTLTMRIFGVRRHRGPDVSINPD